MHLAEDTYMCTLLITCYDWNGCYMFYAVE